jgi:formylmethanofuran--tetrahydromethanopterin N-formyltransferase
MGMPHRAEIEDTYAEAFRSIYAEVLITARDRVWLDHAVNAATGNASSSILCDCEAGLDRYLTPAETPDGRPGAVVQFHVPRFHKDRAQRLERALLVRLSQNVLTCPTAACFNLLDEPTFFKLGRKIAFFGDGWQFRAVRFGRKVWVVPILSGEFVLDRRFGYRDGLMGGNLWLMGASADAALLAAERAVEAVQQVSGVIAPFPGGVASSGSKAGSRYKFAIASTYEAYCPTLREKLGAQSRVPAEVVAIQEIIINGRDLPTIAQATQAAIGACVETPGLVKISAGNYGGRLGKSFVYLRPEKQPV